MGCVLVEVLGFSYLVDHRFQVSTALLLVMQDCFVLGHGPQATTLANACQVVSGDVWLCAYGTYVFYRLSGL